MQVVVKVMERVRGDGNLKIKAKVPCQQQQQQQLSGHYLCSTVAFSLSLSLTLINLLSWFFLVLSLAQRLGFTIIGSEGNVL
jgi:hypothetical protein